MGICIDMCADMHVGMCIEMCANMRVDMCIDLRINMCLFWDSTTDLKIWGMCTDMCIDRHCSVFGRALQAARGDRIPEFSLSGWHRIVLGSVVGTVIMV